MVFWAIEVEPGETVSPFDACPCCESTKLRVTQATLGLGSSKEKSVLQCVTQQKSTVFLCALLPGRTESCSLDLELEKEDSVTFCALGPRSIHLSGYYVEADGSDDTEEEGYGIFDSDGSGSLGSEGLSYNSDDDTNEDDFYYDNSDEDYNAVPKSGVVIEEIIDDDKAANGNSQSKQPKKNKRNDSQENGNQGQIVLKNGASVPVLDSEDEDGLPISKTAPEENSEAKAGQAEKETTKEVPKKKRDVKNTDHDDQSDRRKKVKKQKQADKESKNDIEINAHGNDEVMEDQEKLTKVPNGEAAQVLPQEPQTDNNETQAEKKKKKKKGKKSQDSGNEPTRTDAEKDASTFGEEKPSQVRTFSNGFVVEELSMGKPDGKRAAPGKQVSVYYIGKLQKNGKIFDSNVGKARPFIFRLGIGKVIKGWDVGVNGMRVGDKRRLTIPPAMGYGAKGASGTIPPNSWLVFDVELVDVL